MRQEMMGFWDAVASAGPYAKVCISVQTDNHTDTSSLNFYRPDALPDVQPTVEHSNSGKKVRFDSCYRLYTDIQIVVKSNFYSMHCITVFFVDVLKY